MNEQGNKKILFNKSTLLNLKAELLKKQEEVQEKKRLPQHKLENFKPPQVKPTETDEKNAKRSFKDNLQAINTEELEAYKKTKAALEKKAELYDHLSNPVGDSQMSSKFLVDFNTKKQHEPSMEPPPEEPEDSYDAGESENDSEWTEFTDCLGRTRKCLKTDLELYKEKDENLFRSINKDKLSETEPSSGETEQKKSDKPFLVQKTNDYLHSLREKWEQKEKELLAKDKDIHYQDILFDEARLHGVSYYSFSTDEAERHRQMEELLARHEETLRAQATAEHARRQREDLVAARLHAARARQRLRAGLPPEEPQENQKDFNACLLEFLNKQKEEADTRAKEEERRIKEQIEKERQKLREAYIREWDRGKEGVEDKVKRFKEMTQEEYVEQQRSKRIDEFAPPQSTSSHKTDSFNDRGRRVSIESSAHLKTWSEVRPKIKTPPPPVITDIDIEEQKGLYFSTLKKKQSSEKYEHFVKAQEHVPIHNELSDDESDALRSKPEKKKAEIDHAEIAPPPTYDYYGPVPKHSRSHKPFESDMLEAYAQGTKSLEAKTSNRKLPQQYDFSLE